MDFEEFIKGTGDEVDQYIGWLMASDSYMHSAHFETKNYARHKAYNFFFDAMPDLVDKFGEQWLGYSGRKYVAAIPSQDILPTDTVKFLDELVARSDKVHKKVPNAIKNTIDEIVGICYQTKYLMSFK